MCTSENSARWIRAEPNLNNFLQTKNKNKMMKSRFDDVVVLCFFSAASVYNGTDDCCWAFIELSEKSFSRW